MSKGTHVIIPLVDHLEDERWEAKIVEQNGNKIKLSVNSPASAVIGLYGLTVTTSTLKGVAANTYNSDKNIVMLFNPWCEGKIGSGGCTHGWGWNTNWGQQGRKDRQNCIKSLVSIYIWLDCYIKKVNILLAGELSNTAQLPVLPEYSCYIMNSLNILIAGAGTVLSCERTPDII